MAKDNLKIFGKEYANVTGIKATSANDESILTYTRGDSGGESVIVSDTIDPHGGIIRTITTNANIVSLQSKTVYNNGISQIITADTEYDGLNQVILEGRDDLTEPKDVDFIDYDGRLLYSYTAQEFLTLSELPPNPTNQGLIAQGWNWTLSDAQDYVSQWGALVIGQSYITDDGKTRLYVHIDELVVNRRMSCSITLSKIENGNVIIDWGDGAIVEASVTASSWSPTHIYTQTGDYVVTIEVLSGSFAAGYAWSNDGFWGKSVTTDGNRYVRFCLRKVEIGEGIVSLGNQPFLEHRNVESVSMPITLTGIYSGNTDGKALFGSSKIRGLVFPINFQGRSKGLIGSNSNFLYISVPKATTEIDIDSSPMLKKLTLYSMDASTSTIQLGYASSLTHLVLPGTYQTLPATVQGSLISKFTIPATVTTIQTEALMYSYYLTELHVLPTIVPTMSNTRALQGLNSNCVIYVPYSSDHSILEAYQTATNWSTFASYMQEEPQE